MIATSRVLPLLLALALGAPASPGGGGGGTPAPRHALPEPPPAVRGTTTPVPPWTRFKRLEDVELPVRRPPRGHLAPDPGAPTRASFELVQAPPSRRLVRTARSPTLFCFALASDRAVERRLLVWQHHHGLGIFSCNGHQVFSNRTLAVPAWLKDGEAIMVSQLLSNISTARDRHTNTVMNTDLFLELWRRIFREKRYLSFDMTVKLDVDTVFFPDQLRHVLRRHCRSPGCQAESVHFRQNLTHMFEDEPWRIIHLAPIMIDHAAMLGPIEVFSRRAVAKFAKYVFVCKAEWAQHLREELFGDAWSEHEDVFVDRCMMRLHVLGFVEFRLLLDRMKRSLAHRPCHPGFVAYHPYKTAERHMRCYSQASMRTAGGPSVGQRGETTRRCSTFGFPGGVPRACPLPSVQQLKAIR